MLAVCQGEVDVVSLVVEEASTRERTTYSWLCKGGWRIPHSLRGPTTEAAV